MVEEIHLIPHTHADFGYTDLPDTAKRFLVEQVGAAFELARSSRNAPRAESFRYTFEITSIVEAFLARLNSAERREFGDLIQSGVLEVGAMPFHTTVLLDAEEFDSVAEAPILRSIGWRPRCCFQNDINGLPWGLIPRLKANGVDTVMIGANPYSAGSPPVTPPAGFVWEGPNHDELFVWLGMHYCSGYGLFHEAEWRRGPVPAYDDVWYAPPGRHDIFDPSPESLARARDHLAKRFAGDLKNYPHSVLPAQVTNMWRMDNDPPIPHLPDFVRAWNEAGYLPKLVISTPTSALHELRTRTTVKFERKRGDWPDWWADGVAANPLENTLSQRAKRLLREIPRAVSLLESASPNKKLLTQAWQRAANHTEHTFCSYNSLAQPFHPLTEGSAAHKTSNACQLDEDARNLQAEVVRSSPLFAHPRSADGCIVANPGDHSRTGWVRFPASAFSTLPSGIVDTLTGALLPLEKEQQPVWSAPERSTEPYEVIRDVFSFQTASLKAFIPEVAGKSYRRFRFDYSQQPTTAESQLASEGPGLRWRWNPSKGAPDALNLATASENLLSAESAFELGQPIIEIAPAFGAREEMLHRRPTVIERSAASLKSSKRLPDLHGPSFLSIWEHAALRRIEQRWLFPRNAAFLELETTVWYKERFEPIALFLAFPFATKGKKIFYESLGWKTQAGVDQLPSTCAEVLRVSPAVELVGRDVRVTLTCVDTPLAAINNPQLRSGNTQWPTETEGIFPVLVATHWVTNFPHLHPRKVKYTHRIALSGADSAAVDSIIDDSLWCFPTLSPRGRK